jgi:hypothetical protein
VPPQVQAPFQWCDYKDRLFVVSRGAVAGLDLLVTGRILRPSGEIEKVQLRLSPSSGGSFTVSYVDTGDGWLLNVVASTVTAAPLRGELFVTVGIVREGPRLGAESGVLFSGYLEAYSQLGWPPCNVASSLDGQGKLLSLTPTVPAAGADIVVTVPAHFRWRVLGLSFLLVTAAAVANRLPHLQITDGVSPVYYICAPQVQTASSAWYYNLYPGAGALSPATVLACNYLGPADIRLMAAWTLGTNTINIQAADQYSAIRMLVEQWIES